MAPTIERALAQSQLDSGDARVLLRHVLGVDGSFLIAHSREALTDDQFGRFSGLCARRRAGEPVAYLTGVREFFSLEFHVTPAVLIPRPETELLVEFALEHLAPDAICRVLDLGTGSGCIAISIARHRPRARVIAVDCSAEALAVARENALRLLPLPSPSTGEGQDGGDIRATRQCSIPAPTPALPRQGGGGVSSGFPRRGEVIANLSLMRSEWFGALGAERFDLIVSNPPYVAAADAHLKQGDLRFEPQHALIAGADGMDCIRVIFAAAPRYLEKDGWLALEHGYDQALRCRKLFAQAGYADVHSVSDLAGIERVSAGRWRR